MTTIYQINTEPPASTDVVADDDIMIFYDTSGSKVMRGTAAQFRREAVESAVIGGATLAMTGLSVLATTGGGTNTLPAPTFAGIHKYIVSTNSSTVAVSVVGATTLVQFASSTNSALTFDSAGEAIHLLSTSTTNWAIVGVSSVGSTTAPGAFSPQLAAGS